MTYRQYHVLFNLPVLLVLGLLTAVVGTTLEALGLLVVLVCFVTAVTFPWDNWAVGRGIWDFPEDRVWFRIKNLPIEEVAFFAIETLEVSLLTMILYRLKGAGPVAQPDFGIGIVIAISLVIEFWWVTFKFMRRAWTREPRHTYAWHLLYWIVPLIALQWLFGYPILSPRIDVILASTLIIGGYLTFTDVIAVRQGIWFFDPNKITGYRFFGILPWEEVAFFVLTSLLVAQSITLLLPEGLR